MLCVRSVILLTFGDIQNCSNAVSIVTTHSSSPKYCEEFPLLCIIQTSSGEHPTSYPWVPGALSPAVKRRGHPHPLPQMPSWRSAQLTLSFASMTFIFNLMNRRNGKPFVVSHSAYCNAKLVCWVHGCALSLISDADSCLLRDTRHSFSLHTPVGSSNVLTQDISFVMLHTQTLWTLYVGCQVQRSLTWQHCICTWSHTGRKQYK
jgi:hypothetical protein